MLNELRAVKNPFLRATLAGFGAGSILAMSSAIAIGIANLKGEKAYRNAVILVLSGAGVGTIGSFALGQAKKVDPLPLEVSEESIPQKWQDWRNFVVFRKEKESKEITSFYLRPIDQEQLPDFLPGQFLTIKLAIPEQTRPVIRTYSLSDYDREQSYYRLSIKRELPPKDLDVPPGVSSNFMHDRIEVGSVIPAKPPNGRFVLDVKASTPIVLVSNGVGITPMIAMAKATTANNPGRLVWFFHGARDGSFHALREEMANLAQTNPNLHIHYAYSKPKPEDEGHYQSTGYVDVNLIRSLVKDDAEYFLCGSPAFMDSLRSGLKDAGVSPEKVFFESFTKEKKTEKKAEVNSFTDIESEEKEIMFAKSCKTSFWQNDASSLLEFAESKGLNPDYSCRQGICGTCECKLLEGSVNYTQPPTANVAEGSVLICISKPKSATVVLDL